MKGERKTIKPELNCYAKSGNKSDVWYGKAIRAGYAYDVIQRLTMLRLFDSSSQLLQDISYTYNGVGDIVKAENTAPAQNGIGDPYDNWILTTTDPNRAETHSLSASSSARYYNSDLSIWISVDPLADKYPNLSPYTYCADNPVRLVDPDGRDTIFVDKKIGKTTIYNRAGNDVLICGKKAVTLSGKSVYADAEAKGKEQVKEGSTLLVGMSNYDAKKTFNFMADNTGVEWGYMESVNSSGQTEFLVGSAHSSETESLVFGKAMDAPEGSVLRYDHSHIYPIHGSSWQKATAGMPSTSSTSANSKKYSDIEAWNDLVRKNPSISIGIRYNKQTIIHVKKGIWQ